MHRQSQAGLARATVIILLSALALIAAIWAVILERIEFEHGEAIAGEVKRNSNLAQAFEQHIDRTLAGLDQAVGYVKREFGLHGAKLDLRKMVDDGLINPRLVNAVGIVDERGVSLLGLGAAGRSMEDRDYFRFHRQYNSSALRIGVPVQGRVSGQLSVHITRRVSKADGSFGGVALVAVHPDYFSDFSRRVDLGPGAMTMLVGVDGIVRSRRVGNIHGFGQDLRRAVLFRELAKSDTGSFTTDGAIDGVVRHVSYRKVPGYPLVVSVGTAADETFAQFHSRQRNYHLGASLATFFVLLFAGGVVFALSSRRDAVKAKAGIDATYRTTFDHAAVGIAHLTLDGRFVKVNARLCAMLRHTEAELLALSCVDVIDPDDENDDRTSMRRLMAATLAAGSADAEKRCLRRDGSMMSGALSIALVRDAQGKPDFVVVMVQDITARTQAQAQLLRQAEHDHLTDLPNRVLCYDRLRQALNQARRHARPVGVLFVDLDRFKDVNDTMGHASGDALLREASHRLVDAVRVDDTVARIGGDEFVVILARLSKPQDASTVAEKIRKAVSAPLRLDGQEVVISASVGISIFPGDGEDAEALVRNADAAMFRAKQVGRDNFQYYTAAMNEHAMEKLRMQNDLRRALERDEFVLHYQPKVSLGTGQITGFEALLRWNRPDHALVSPSEFVPLLEDTGLIVPVGDWVADAACAQMRRWRDAGLHPAPVAVNVSAKQFLHHDIASVIERALQRHGLDAGMLEVEITESDAMQNPEEVGQALQRMRHLGIRVAVDDFGTGYASLGYLKRFPLDALKLDRSFVTGLPSSADDVSIARAVIGMAHSLGLKVIAEGVETQAQKDFLARHGCDEMQGYLLSRPVPTAECEKLLRPGALVWSPQ